MDSKNNHQLIRWVAVGSAFFMKTLLSLTLWSMPSARAQTDTCLLTVGTRDGLILVDSQSGNGQFLTLELETPLGWSADGQTLYTIPAATPVNVPLYAYTGGTPREIATLDTGSTALSPDGRTLAYIGVRAETVTEESLENLVVKLFNLETGEQRLLNDLAAPGFLFWSPDGVSLGVAQNTDDEQTHVVILNALSGETRQQSLIEAGQIMSRPLWLPDNRGIILEMPHPLPGDADHAMSDGRYINYLYRLNPNTGSLSLLVERGRSPVWYPGDEKLLYIQENWEQLSFDEDADTDRLPFLDDLGINPTFSPDGRFVAYTDYSDTTDDFSVTDRLVILPINQPDSTEPFSLEPGRFTGHLVWRSVCDGTFEQDIT